MAIRLGFIGNSKILENCATDKTVSVEALNKADDNVKKIARLKKVAKSNILNTLKILENNKKLGIKVYGLSYRLFPLANYPDLEYFRYIDSLNNELLELGNYIKENDFRVNVFLENTIILNPLSERLYGDAIKNIKYQNVLLNAMGLDEKYKIIVNFGGGYINKEDSLDRFRVALERLDEAVKKRLVVNNQDKLIGADEIIDICKYYSIPYFLNLETVRQDNLLIEKSIQSWECSDMPALLGLNGDSGLINLSGLGKNIDVVLTGGGKDANITKKITNF